MADSNVFSTRIVSIDYYMAPPIPDLDICYSSFQGGKVNEVPVIRIYGSTPAGQKTCLHIHRALPYLYVPCADISVQPHHGDDAYPRVISIAIEKALKLRSNAGSKRQHVHGCSLVRARKLYGYHSTEELFVKIYLYYPHDVSRAANLLLGGAVMNKGLQPHESHIPFLLQFLIDYNLYGMGHLHVSKMKFRHPVPDLFSPRKANLSGKHGQETIHSTPVPDLFSPRKANLSGKRAQETIHSTSMVTSFQADPSGGSFLGSPVWISSTIPDGWLWQCTVELDVSPDPGIHLVKRQSSCELEGDAAVDEILNQQFKMYSSLSQTHSSVNMVQSLIPIWEEEYERTGVHETAIPPDPGKPNPEDVLKILLHGLELENKLVELGGEAEISSGSFEKDSRSPLSIGSSADKGSLIEQEDSKTSIKDGESLSNVKNILESVLSQGVLSEEDHIAAPSEEEDVYPKTLSFDELPPSDGIGTLGLKAADKEALGLLKWLTSSQAAEDINSDDELAHETILSPLFPATTIDKVLERANKEYESESHQECQDILDSIDDLIDFEGLKEGNSCSVNHGNSSGKIIPQVDGSGDEQYRTPGTDSFEIDITSESGRPSQHQLQKEMSLRSTSIHKKKDPFWGSLPFSIAQENVVQSVTCNMTGGSAGTKASTGTGSGKEADIYSGRSLNSAMANVCDSKEASLLVGGSVRDLMRKKRSYRLESPDSGTHKITKILLKEDSNERMLIQSQQLDFQTAQSVAQEMAPVESHIISSAVIDQQREIFGRSTCMATCALDAGGEASDVKPVLSNWSMYGKLPLSSCCDGLLQDYASKDRHFDSCEILDAEAAGNISVSCPLHEGTRNFLQPSYFEKQDSAVSGDHCKNCAINELGSASSSVVPVTCDGNTCSKPDKVVNRQLMKCDTEDKLLADDGLRQVDAAGLSHCSTCNVEADMSRKDTYNCKSSHKSCNFFECAPGRDNCSYMSGCSVSKVVDIEAKPTGLVSMTLCKRPPTMDWADGTSENVLWSPTLSNCPLYGNGEICKGTSVQGRGADEYLPFFDNRGEKEVSNKCHIKKDFNSLQGVKGVPTHYQNDGSVLYMLTPMFSPPSRDSVSRWLLHDDSGTSRENSRTVLVKPSSVKNKGLSTGLLGPQGSPADTCYNVLPESCSDTHVKPILSQPNHEKHQCLNTEERISCNDVTPPLRSEGSTVTLKKCSDCSQDVSQISGPAGNLKPTPVSQMGFRDSASVGGGQQLTLFSIEVLAESRGDLRPNPKFDAINIIALAIQEDNDDILDVNVLLRSNTESYQRNHHGISGCKVLVSSEEKHLLKNFLKIIHSFDPDILLGWDIQGGSLGFLAERAAHLGIDLLNDISRTPSEIKAVSGDSEIPSKGTLDNIPPESLPADSILLEDAIIEDEWGRTHASGIHVGGRVVLNVWRLMRSEVKLNMYTIEAVAEAVLRRKVPLINYRVLTKWYSSGPGQARYRCIEYAIQRSKLNLQIMNKLDMINRTSELARVFGIDFFSVLSRGSQYRVESMLLRLAHTQNYLAISPGRQQVASQPAMECLPLVMEPESGFYADPVVVLDFQSLYPSMIIAYNLCFCTCLGKILSSKPDTLGVSSFALDPSILRSLRQKILLTPNGVMYVPSKVCKGILPRLLEEILSTRIMVKQAMKKLTPSQQVLYRILNARQLALKLIANVTYGYTAAGFSGRMPCAELADSIVQCGRRTLENAISFVNAHDKWKARVIYGDTDSMFVLLKGRTVKEAFQIGQEIASEVTTMNPNPVTLKMEKVYQPCILVTKKRYVGYSYESPDQLEPVFDAKGIETVRRDTCSAVAKMMEQSLRLFFEYQDLLKVKSYLQRQWTRILSGRVSLQDFVFAKEVRLGAYSTRASSSLPPAAIVAMKAMRVDPRAEPRYAERIPYVVIHGEPGARLVDMVVDPLDLLSIDSPFRLNDLYYINKQIIPALQRIFGLVGNDLNQWFLEMPRPIGESLAKRHFYAPNLQRTRIDYYYLSKHCVLCGELVHASAHLCNKCSNKGIAVAAAVTGRTSKLEREMQHLAAICCHCGGGDWVIESGVKCTSLACTVFFERRKVQKELLALSAVAADAGFYPRCMIEWF